MLYLSIRADLHIHEAFAVLLDLIGALRQIGIRLVAAVLEHSADLAAHGLQ